MIEYLKKNFSFIGMVAVILIISVAGFYFINLKQGKYSSSSFQSIDVKWGMGDNLANEYNSKTMMYNYLDDKDKLVHKRLELHTNEVIFLHSKLADIDFWSLPNVVANKNANLKDKEVVRYEITIVYDEETKKIVYLTNYDEDNLIANRMGELQETITNTLNEAEDRYTN